MEFTNQAQLIFNNRQINSNVAVGQILGVLTATKTSVSDTYTRGADVTYAISLINGGTAPLTGLTVTDDLGAYEENGNTYYPLTYVADSAQFYVNGVLQTADLPGVTPGPPLVFSDITVPAGGNVMILYETTVNEFAPLEADATIVNTATVTGTGLTMPVTDSNTISVEDDPDLTITKSISPVPVSENGRLTYTFVIQNYGNAEAVADDDILLRDLFDPILRDLAVTFNGDLWTEDVNYRYNETTGLFETLPGQITVPAASFTRDPDTGAWTTTPGVSTFVVVGTV